MKTQKIEQIAANYNYFKIDAIPENILNDVHFQSNFEHAKNKYNSIVIPDGLQNIKGIEISIFCEVKEQFKNHFGKDADPKIHELFFIDNICICIYSIQYDTMFQLMQRNGKFEFFPLYPDYNKLTRSISYEQRKPFLSKLVEPNKIGVFTQKKVDAWLQYCNDYLIQLAACNESINNKHADNLAKIENTIQSLSGCKVERYSSYTILATKLFRIEFELQDNGTYLRQKIEFKGNLNTIIDLQL